MAQLPTYLQKSAAPDLVKVAQQALGGINPPYLSIKGGLFTLVDQAGNEMRLPTFDPQVGVYVDCCIIDMNPHKSRIFYENDFDPTAQAYLPPECWSDNGTGPSAQSSKPQAPTCASCNWSVWGSATSAQGKAIPACQEVHKLAIMVPGLGPQVDNMIFLLRCPPASLKNLRSYAASFSGQGINLADVITRIYFDRAQLGILLFQVAPAPQGMPLPYISEQTYQLREAAYIEKKTDMLVGKNDVARNPALPAAQAPAQLAPPQGTGQAPVQTAPAMQGQQPAMQAPQGAQAGFIPGVTTAPPVGSAPTQMAYGFGTTNPTAPPVSLSNGAQAPAQGQRRRRRTNAEIQAANQAAAPQQPAAQASLQPATQAPIAPFPVQGQPAPAAAAAPPNNFGMQQPAAANPEMQQMLAGLGFKPPGQA